MAGCNKQNAYGSGVGACYETGNHREVRMRSKRQCKTGAIQLRTTATRTIKRHALNRTVNRQSSGAILAELKHRLYALLGAVCGIAAAGFVRGLHLLENLFDKIRERYT